MNIFEYNLPSMSNFPTVGQTKKAHCKDLDKVTTWEVIKEDETYSWLCTECPRKVVIGQFKKDITAADEKNPK